MNKITSISQIPVDNVEAYLDGYNKAIEDAAEISSFDRRSPIAKDCGYKPEFHKALEHVTEGIRKLKK